MGVVGVGLLGVRSSGAPLDANAPLPVCEATIGPAAAAVLEMEQAGQVKVRARVKVRIRARIRLGLGLRVGLGPEVDNVAHS